MSTRIVCDRCGHDADPPGRRSVIHLTELEFAASDPRHPAAENSYLPADLCAACTDIIKAALDCALHVGQKYMPEEGEMTLAMLDGPHAGHSHWAPPMPQPPPPPWAIPEETPLTHPLPPDGPGHTLVMDAVTEQLPAARDNGPGER